MKHPQEVAEVQQRLDCARQALTEAQVTENGKDGIQTPCGVKVGDSTPVPMQARSGKKVDDSTPETLQGRSGRKVADQSTPDTMQLHFEFVMLSGACLEPLTMEVDGMTSCGSIFSHLNLDSELGWRIVLPATGYAMSIRKC